MSSDKTKSNYNLLLAIAFVGIGSWKTYGYFQGDKEMATYQIFFAVVLICLGFYQLWRWNIARKENEPES